MADFGTALHARLAADPEVAAMVVGGGKRRIYPKIRPQGSPLPAIAYEVPGGSREEHLKGYTGTRRPRTQINCYGRTHEEALRLAESSTSALAMPMTIAGVQFGRGKADEPRDGGGDDTPDGYIHLVLVDLFIEYRPL